MKKESLWLTPNYSEIVDVVSMFILPVGTNG
jgi:hypothetical protein